MEPYDPEKFAAASVVERDRMIRRRALDLRPNEPPEFNLFPTVQLVEKAFYMGFDVVLPASASEGRSDGA